MAVLGALALRGIGAILRAGACAAQACAAQRLTAGMCAGFPAGARDGHHLVNRSARDAVYLEVGDRKEEDQCYYSDVDLHYGPRATDGRFGFTRKNGQPY